MGSSLLNASLMSSRVLQLTWSCGAVSTLHSHWLRDNDPSHRHATGQRTTYLKNFSSLGNLSHAQLTTASTSSGSPGELHLKWDDGQVASYQEDFLRRHARYRDDTVNPPKVLTVDTPVPCHGFSSFHNDDKALHAFLDDLIVHGVTLLRGCPTDDETVLNICRRINVEKHTLYGSSW
eukprot:PhF_6_TR8272/c1_g2_i2/m.12630